MEDYRCECGKQAYCHQVGAAPNYRSWTAATLTLMQKRHGKKVKPCIRYRPKKEVKL